MLPNLCSTSVCSALRNPRLCRRRSRLKKWVRCLLVNLESVFFCALASHDWNGCSSHSSPESSHRKFRFQSSNPEESECEFHKSSLKSGEKFTYNGHPWWVYQGASELHFFSNELTFLHKCSIISPDASCLPVQFELYKPAYLCILVIFWQLLWRWICYLQCGYSTWAMMSAVWYIIMAKPLWLLQCFHITVIVIHSRHAVTRFNKT